MALAFLEFIGIDRGQARFHIDIGTNNFYSFVIGKQVREGSGDKWVDEISHKTPMQPLASGNSFFKTDRDVAIPASLFNREDCYVQLFSYKDRQGKSTAYSRAMKIPVGVVSKSGDHGYSFSRSQNIVMPETYFSEPRTIPQGMNGNGYSTQTSADEILTGLLKLAGPMIMGLVQGLQNAPAGTGNSSGNGTPQLGMLNTILDTLLKGLKPTAQSLSVQHSMYNGAEDANRFQEGNEENYSRPFIFGIDDALLATLAGPIIQQGLQLLPQLMNSMNQQKLQSKLATNKLMTDLVADTNRRMMLQQFLQNQQAAPAGAPVDINALMQLLQQQQAAAPQPEAVAPAVAKSLSINGGIVSTLSTKAILSFDTAPALSWNGTDKIIYNRQSEVRMMVRLNVTGDPPKNPLPKCIIGFHFKDDTGKIVFEKVFKMKNILPATPVECLFTAVEISQVPANRPLTAIAEMRWLTASGKEVKCLGSASVVFASSYFLKQVGGAKGEEKELADMKVYRAFWNKVWEAPVLDGKKTAEGAKKYNWQLDATLRYNFCLTGRHDTNGLMETKLLESEKDESSMTEKASGKMKSGIELSLDEVNKLCSMWDKQPLLTQDQLSAFRTKEFAKANSNEFIKHVQLKGRTGERGMVWVLPVFRLHECTLSKMAKTNDKGQVTEVTEEKVQFPLPVMARIIGLKSS
jgi:hypothetical protein